MLFGKHKPRSSGARRRETFQPRAEDLETRVVLTVADLANVAVTPLGVQLASKSAAQGLGFSVAMLGDTNADSFQDVLVGAPGITPNAAGVAQNFNRPTGIPFLATANGPGTAYLVFGSSKAQSGNTDFKTLTSPGQRTGAIAQIGNAAQINPAIAGTPNAVGFPFNGVTFTTGMINANDNLGASVADAGILPTANGAGGTVHSFLIGAPGANKAYLVVGSPLLTPSGTTNLSITLNTPPAGIGVVTFISPTATDQVGRNVSLVPNLLGTNVDYLAISAPNFTKPGVRGAVFLIPTTSLAALAGTTVDVSKTGLAAGIAGEIELDNPSNLTIPSASIPVSSVVNFDGTGTTSLIVGLPDNLGGKGEADLIYGGNILKAEIAAQGSILNLQNVGAVVAPILQGAQFTGTNVGEAAGYSVSTARDFNGDGLDDIMIGSPGFGTDQGKVTLVYGRSTGAANGAITGIRPLDSLGAQPDPLNFVIFLGDNNKNNNNATAPSPNYLTNSLAGFSVGVAMGGTSIIGTKNPTLLIGSPGVNFTSPGGTSSGQGAVYLIPATTTNLTGTFNLTTQAQQTLNALILDDSSKVDQSQGVNVNTGLAGPLGIQVGVSVSSTTSGTSPTLDTDSTPDIAIGAPLSSLSVNNFAGGNQAGSLFLVEGAFLSNIGAGSGSGSGGGVAGGGGGVSTVVTSSIVPPIAPISASQIAPGSQFGPDRWSPTLAAFSQYNYVPIPTKVAYAQFYPSAPFQQRIRNYYNPPKVQNQYSAKGGHNTHGNVTLGQAVFNRSKYKTGKVVEFTHKVPVVPVQRQTERFTPGGGLQVAPKKK